MVWGCKIRSIIRSSLSRDLERLHQMTNPMVRGSLCDVHPSDPCKDYLQEFQIAFKQLGQAAGVQAVLFLDLSGRVLGSWYTGTDLHIESVVSLVSGKWAAADALAEFLGSAQRCNFITHDYDSFRLLLARAGSGQMLLSITATDVPVGWTRLQMQRLANLYSGIEACVSRVTLAPSPLAAVSLS